MQNTRIIYKNLWRDGTIINYSSRDIQFPAESTQDDPTTLTWKSRGLPLSAGITVPATASTGTLLTYGSCNSTTGWVGTDCTLASIAGGQTGNCLELTRTGAGNQFANCDYGIVTNLTAGKLYKLQGYVKSGTSGADLARMMIMDHVLSVNSLSAVYTSSGTWQLMVMYFYAKSTGQHGFYFNKSSATPGTMLFDTMALFELTTHSIMVFDEGSDYLYAPITAGNYATGALLATEVNTQLDAAGGTYTVSYSDVTGKFTIARAAGNFSLYWNDGSATHIGVLMGFHCGAADTGSATYTSDDSIFTLDEYLDLDIGQATEFDFISIRNHNLSSSAVITLYGADDSAFTTNVTSDVLTWNENNLSQFLAASRTKRYVRLRMIDSASTSYMMEIGTIVLGKYYDLADQISQGYENGAENDSESEETNDGVIYLTVAHSSFDTWKCTWEQLTAAAKEYADEAVRECGSFACVIFCFDYTDANHNTIWAVMQSPARPVNYSAASWIWTVELRESV